jgi:hypothetical protein
MKIMPYHEEWHECNGMPFVEIKYEPTVEEILIELDQIEKQYHLQLKDLTSLNDEELDSVFDQLAEDETGEF